MCIRDRVSVLLGDGNGGFAARTDVAVGASPYAVAVADFDGDRAKDVVTADFSAQTVTLLRGDGSGGFGAARAFAVGLLPRSVAAADLNGDGKADVVTANYGADTVSVLRNTSGPRIAALSTARARVGSTVTIKGWGFGARRGASKVYFGSKAATKYVSWAKGTIRVKVPAVSAGHRTVRVRTVDGRSSGRDIIVR
jgi:hypothetical protein